NEERSEYDDYNNRNWNGTGQYGEELDRRDWGPQYRGRGRAMGSHWQGGDIHEGFEDQNYGTWGTDMGTNRHNYGGPQGGYYRERPVGRNSDRYRQRHERDYDF